MRRLANTLCNYILGANHKLDLPTLPPCVDINQLAFAVVSPLEIIDELSALTPQKIYVHHNICVDYSHILT